MVIHILLAALLAKIKGYKLKPMIKAYSLYPHIVAEIVYIILQVGVFAGDYSYIQYAAILKTIYLYTLIIPILVYGLYKQGIYGSVLITVGSMLNKFVMNQNGGKMPVFASLSKITGYFNEAQVLNIDNIHIVGNEATKYKFLTDFIDIGYSILSIGDILIHTFVLIIIYSVIKEVNKNTESITDDKRGFIRWKYSK